MQLPCPSGFILSDGGGHAGRLASIQGLILPSDERYFNELIKKVYLETKQ
jgi:hypothetical protein